MKSIAVFDHTGGVSKSGRRRNRCSCPRHSRVPAQFRRLGREIARRCDVPEPSHLKHDASERSH